MPELVDVLPLEDVSDSPYKTASGRDYSHLKRYHFQPGNTIAKKGGRPKGVLNSQTILMKSAPKMAKAYVKTALEGNPTLLKDFREWSMPVDGSDAGSRPQIILLVGDGALPQFLAQPQALVVQPSNALAHDSVKSLSDALSVE